jgi:ketosteroid isomerase-like protein
MKYITLLSFLTIISIAGFAQTKDESAVAAAVEKLKKAMIDGDRASLTAIASEKLSYGHSGGLVEGKEEFVEKIASGKSDFVTMELSDQTIAVSGNVALVRHQLNATINDNNTPGTVKLKVLLVWQKDKGEWKLLARQAVKTT